MSAQISHRRTSPSQRWKAWGIALTLAVGCGAAVSGASEPAQGKSDRAGRHAPAKALPVAGIAANQQPAAGHVLTYLNIRALQGVQPVQLPGGAWAMQRTAHAPGIQNQVGGEQGLAQDERDLSDVLQRHQVTSIVPFYGLPFRRPDLAQQYGLDRAYVMHIAPGASVHALQRDLLKFPVLIERAELDTTGSIAGPPPLTIPDDPSFNQQWDMHNTGQVIAGSGGTADADIDAPEAWSLHTGSASTIIAVLDTGIQADHPDLTGKVINGVDTFGMFGPPPANWGTDISDIHGHGTHCAGIAAAQGNNSIGVSGTNWNARILAMRVTNSAGDTNQNDVAEAVIYAADNDADVISMSLQFFSQVNVNLESACAYAYDGGALPVAASGNNGGATVAWPARYIKCMAVGATTNTDARWPSSSYGPELDLVAPGVNIFGLWRNSGYTTSGFPGLQSGTSMATPHVSGLAALLMSYNRLRGRALSVPQIEQIIKDSVDDIGAPGWEPELGWGRLNLRAALEAATVTCEGDANGSGTVNVDDLLAVITGWGVCPAPPTACPPDVFPSGSPPGNGVVNVDDLLSVITHWGVCP